MRRSGSTPWCRTPASRTCWPTCTAGPGLPTPSRTCTQAYLRTTRASCSPACWPNLAGRKLYAFGSASDWPALAPFIAGRPDEKLIAAQWDDVLRLTTSVRTGTVRASLMLKRLGAYPRQNGLALALREFGRIERTLYAARPRRS